MKAAVGLLNDFVELEPLQKKLKELETEIASLKGFCTAVDLPEAKKLETAHRGWSEGGTVCTRPVRRLSASSWHVGAKVPFVQTNTIVPVKVSLGRASLR